MNIDLQRVRVILESSSGAGTSVHQTAFQVKPAERVRQPMDSAEYI